MATLHDLQDVLQRIERLLVTQEEKRKAEKAEQKEQVVGPQLPTDQEQVGPQLPVPPPKKKAEQEETKAKADVSYLDKLTGVFDSLKVLFFNILAIMRGQVGRAMALPGNVASVGQSILGIDVKNLAAQTVNRVGESLFGRKETPAAHAVADAAKNAVNVQVVQPPPTVIKTVAEMPKPAQALTEAAKPVQERIKEVVKPVQEHIREVAKPVRERFAESDWLAGMKPKEIARPIRERFAEGDWLSGTKPSPIKEVAKEVARPIRERFAEGDWLSGSKTVKEVARPIRERFAEGDWLSGAKQPVAEAPQTASRLGSQVASTAGNAVQSATRNAGQVASQTATKTATRAATSTAGAEAGAASGAAGAGAAAAGAAAGAEGGAGTAGALAPLAANPVGAVALVVVAAVALAAALASLPVLIKRWGESLLDSQRHLGETSGKMAQILAKFDVFKVFYEMKIGNKLSKTSGKLEESLEHLMLTLQPYIIGLMAFVNIVTTAIIDFTNYIVQWFETAGMEILGWIDKISFHQTHLKETAENILKEMRSSETDQQPAALLLDDLAAKWRKERKAGLIRPARA